MEIISKTAEEIQFTSDIDVSLANAIRRSVSEIPILAIYEADVYKNDSVLYDEVISHRLGLIPLKNQKLKTGQNIAIRTFINSFHYILYEFVLFQPYFYSKAVIFLRSMIST